MDNHALCESFQQPEHGKRFNIYNDCFLVCCWDNLATAKTILHFPFLNEHSVVAYLTYLSNYFKLTGRHL